MCHAETDVRPPGAIKTSKLCSLRCQDHFMFCMVLRRQGRALVDVWPWVDCLEPPRNHPQ